MTIAIAGLPEDQLATASGYPNGRTLHKNYTARRAALLTFRTLISSPFLHQFATCSAEDTGNDRLPRRFF